MQALKKVLEPLDNFVVSTPEKLAFVDKTRKLFDTSVDEDGTGALCNAVKSSVQSCEILKSLLAVGVDPDTPSITQKFRPSHICGSRGLVEAARCIFPCRPNMTALNVFGRSPLRAAQITHQVTSVTAP